MSLNILPARSRTYQSLVRALRPQLGVIAQAAKRRKGLTQGTNPGSDFMDKTSRGAAAALQPSAPLGLRRRRISNPALTRWAMLSRRFAAATPRRGDVW